jgi:hypothetical protein
MKKRKVMIAGVRLIIVVWSFDSHDLTRSRLETGPDLRRANTRLLPLIATHTADINFRGVAGIFLISCFLMTTVVTLHVPLVKHP